MATVIFDSDNSVQGTITSITSTPLGINTYAYNTNLSSFSTYSTLSVCNLNATSTTIFNNLDSLSSNSTLSVNNLYATSTAIFNNLNSFSTFQHYQLIIQMQHQLQFSIKRILLIYMCLKHLHSYHH